jgi:phosphatidylglycerophosphate synthase
MPKYVYIVNDIPVSLWGLSSSERLKRMLVRAGDFNFIEELASLPDGSSVLILRADFLYDDRIIKRLAFEENTLLQVSISKDLVAVAAVVKSQQAVEAEKILSKGSLTADIPGVSTVRLQDWSSGFQEQLRKFDPPYVLQIAADNTLAFEEHLYSGSYKGVTDLVTKWAWPIPAKWVVRICVKAGITPNAVTIISLILTIIAGVCFAHGHYATGLAAGWLMTFLDTVDGKLARVTVTSSKIGHILDHGLDIIHPPLWYIAWGMGLSFFTPPTYWLSLHNIFGIILAGYILGRMCEGLFQLWLGKFGLFCWRPFDSFNRLITARRNPSLILLSGSLCFARPDLGLLAVVAWTVLSTFIIFIRLLSALALRRISGQPIRPWLADIGTVIDSNSLAARIFTKPPLTTTIQSED